MLVFIIPLKSPQVSQDWQLVCKLFARTLRSVCNQTSERFKIIVACHELPKINFSHPNVSYKLVDCPIPNCDFISKDKDKMYKMLVGLQQAQNFNPSHIMFVDADDCVSKYLAEFVEKNRESNGWFANCGYEYREDSKSLLVRNNNFHLRSNTSHIIKNKLLKNELLKNNVQIDINNISHGNFILQHIDTFRILQEKGFLLAPLPFKAVVYITNNGENIWWNENNLDVKEKNLTLNNIIKLFVKKIYWLTITRPLTSSIYNEFGI